MKQKVINIVLAGIGGQGVIKASDILADALFHAGFEVKKAEIHGMSQRGGSVTSDVRFGREEVLSPMVPPGEADFLVVLAADQVGNNQHHLRVDGILIPPECIQGEELPHARSLNVALLGVLSGYLPQVPESSWIAAVKANLPTKVHGINEDAFRMGRSVSSYGAAVAEPDRQESCKSQQQQ